MPIKAIFANGQTEITVNGLHQWDYGQTLEIYSENLPTVVEVHFACVGMEEAVVRACETSTGKAVATIPDRCLEQTTPITAWVFEISGTNGSIGTTTKKITLPIEARTRPSVAKDIPTAVSDKYTEVIAEVNTAIATLHSGLVPITVNKAYQADDAAHADEADHATAADTAAELSTKNQKLQTGQGGFLAITLDPNKAYIIAIGDGEGERAPTYENMLMFMGQADEADGQGYGHYSTTSYNGFYCYYFKGSNAVGSLHFKRPVEPRNPANFQETSCPYAPVFIREI